MAGELSRYLAKIGAKGGAKSRRVLTPEQAKAMVKARELKRSERAAGAGVGKKARRTKKGKALNESSSGTGSAEPASTGEGARAPSLFPAAHGSANCKRRVRNEAEREEGRE